MTAHRLQISATLVALTLLTACDGNNQPPPTPSTTSTSSSAPATNPAAQAPRVQNSLDAAGFVLDPCKSLTEAQQKRFGLDQPRVVDVAVEGKSCFYRQNRGAVTAVSVTYAIEMDDGLSSRYREHAAGTWNYWEPTTVDGYPAVGYGASHSANPHPASCNFAVGVSDSLYFWVTADDTPGAAKCSAAKDVASAVLSTIKTGR